VKLVRAGNEWKASCPFHADRSPSFTIYEGGERFHCFGCGAGGDVLDYLQRAHDVGLREAVAMLEGGKVPMVVQPPLPPEQDRDTTAEAITIWRSAGPITATPAEAYLRGRGLDLRLPDSLRFARLRYGSKTLPCLVALIANDQNKIGGIQRTFVKEDGSGKADVPAPKLSLGRIAGGAIRLAPAAGKLVVTGGLEDGLTLQQELGQAVWAATGEGNIANMALPVRSGALCSAVLAASIRLYSFHAASYLACIARRADGTAGMVLAFMVPPLRSGRWLGLRQGSGCSRLRRRRSPLLARRT
jgi:DNA primase